MLYNQAVSLPDLRANFCIWCDWLSTVSDFCVSRKWHRFRCPSVHHFLLPAGPGQLGYRQVVARRAWAIYLIAVQGLALFSPGLSLCFIVTVLAFCIVRMFLFWSQVRDRASFRLSTAADLDLPRALAGAWFCQLQINCVTFGILETFWRVYKCYGPERQSELLLVCWLVVVGCWWLGFVSSCAQRRTNKKKKSAIWMVKLKLAPRSSSLPS